METNTNILYGQALNCYQNKQYKETIDICNQIVGYDDENFMIANILTTHAALYLILPEDPNSEDLKKFISTSIDVFASRVQSIEDALEFEYSLTKVVNECEKINFINKLNEFTNNVNTTNAQNLLVNPSYVMFTLLIRPNISNNANVKRLLSEVGCTKITEAEKKLGIKKSSKYEKSFSSTERHKLIYKCIHPIFLNLIQDIANNLPGSGEYAEIQRDEYFEKLRALWIASELSYPTDSEFPIKGSESWNDEIKHIKFSASIIEYMINSCTFPDNQKSFLFSEQARDYLVEELIKVYQKIQKFDDTFVIPEIKRESIQTSGCYIATAVYGSYDCPEVWTLRRFRDYTLASTWYGRIFIHIYYAISPTIVMWFGKSEWFKNVWKPNLDKLVNQLNVDGFENTPYNDREWK